MTYKHYNAAVDELGLFSGANKRYLYLECCYRADSKGRILIPQTTLAEITRLSLRTVAGLFAEMEKERLIVKVMAKGKERHGQYMVTIPPREISGATRPSNEPIPATPEKINDFEEWLEERRGEGYIVNNPFDDGDSLIVPDYERERLSAKVQEAVNQGRLRWLWNEDFDGEPCAVYAIIARST